MTKTERLALDIYNHLHPGRLINKAGNNPEVETWVSVVKDLEASDRERILSMKRDEVLRILFGNPQQLKTEVRLFRGRVDLAYERVQERKARVLMGLTNGEAASPAG